MADVYKSRADLLTDFANNTMGLITPQKMRNLIISTLGEYAVMRGSAAEYNETIVSSSAPKILKFCSDVEISDSIIADPESGCFDVPTAGTYLVEVGGAWKGSHDAVELHVELWKREGGGALVATEYRALVANTTVYKSSSQSWIVACAGGTDLAIYGRASVSNRTIYSQYGYFSVRRIM